MAVDPGQSGRRASRVSLMRHRGAHFIVHINVEGVDPWLSEVGGYRTGTQRRFVVRLPVI